MGLSWQQGPLGRNPNGQFLVPDMPQRVLYAEPLRRRMRAELGGRTVVESDDAVVLFEPGRYPVAYFPIGDFAEGALRPIDHRSEHPDLGETAWFEVAGGARGAARGAWQHVALPEHAAILRDKVALAWRAMDGFYEEDERILGHAADPYHRIDIRRTSRHLVVRARDRVVAETASPLVLYESGFAPRWYVPREDVAPTRWTRRSCRRSARTRASPPTTTSSARGTPPGPTARRSTTWRRSATSSRSSPTASKSRWTANASRPSPGRTSSRTASIAT
jgi:uncharacterized protein (DUF427 family)